MMSWDLHLLVVPVLVLLVTIVHFTRKKYETVPGPRAWPMLGNAVAFLGLSPVDIFSTLIKFGKTYGKMYKLDFFYDYTIVYGSPEAAEIILTSPAFAAKSEDYDKVSEWIGTGLLTSKGTKWFTHRKVITPGFHFKILEHFVPAFSRRSEAFCEQLEQHGPEEVDVFPRMKLLTLDIICETAMGISGAEQSQNSFYTGLVEELMSILYLRMFNLFANIDFLFRLSKTGRKFERLVAKTWSFTYEMIEKRRKLNEGRVELESSGKTRRALLDTLLEARVDGKPLSDVEIREEVDTFTFAGHDTTASALTFILYNVAKYADVQQRLHEEIVEIVGADFCELTLYTLNNLNYMELVIKESLRLFPPVPMIARLTVEDTELLGIPIAKGTCITVDIFSMHRNPAYFRDADTFHAERFQEERIAEKFSPYTYIPFSAGSRNCIGQKFAMYELKTTLVKILQRFHVQLPHADFEPTLKAEIVLKPAYGMPLRFVRR